MEVKKLYKLINNRCFFAEAKGKIVLTDPFISDYYGFMLKSKKIGTTKKHIIALHKFWLYCIYFPAKEKQSFNSYIIDYRHTLLKNGFKVELVSEDNSKPIVLHEYEAIKDVGFDMSALEQYYIYLSDEDVNPNADLFQNFPLEMYFSEKNIKAMKIKDRHSRGKGYGLKSRGLMREALADRITIFTKLKETKGGFRKQTTPLKNETFPLEAFDLFLESIKQPRRKLLYILCGACSARVAQALSLTIYDIDLENERVYLTDPLSNSVPHDPDGVVLKSQPPRRELLRKYGIDFAVGRYKSIQFKYPIPSKDSPTRELYFLFPKYRKMFFDTYLEWRAQMDTSFPMIFQAQGKKGTNILLVSNAYDYIKSDFDRFDKLYPEYNVGKLANKYHSFRHMFGTCMADKAFLTHARLSNLGVIELPDKTETNIIEAWKIITRRYMGHNSKDSTDIYFNISRQVEDYVANLIYKNEDLLEIKNDISNAILEAN